MTDEQLANLKKLATYLLSLPENYNEFEMGTFMDTNLDDNAPEVIKYLTSNDGLPGCGTSACAVGHGPAAHIFLIKEELPTFLRPWPHWDDYTRRVFGMTSWDKAFVWLFGGSWSNTDNTPHGAAKRILYFLEHGVPEGFETAHNGERWVELYS